FGGLAILNPLLDFQLDLEDYLRIMMVLFIHSGLFLICLALIETIIASAKLRLLGQSFFTFLLIIASGTLIPTIYFPLSLQEFILNERFYVDYVPLLLMGLTGLFILVGCSLWKERIKA